MSAAAGEEELMSEQFDRYSEDFERIDSEHEPGERFGSFDLRLEELFDEAAEEEEEAARRRRRPVAPARRPGRPVARPPARPPQGGKPPTRPPFWRPPQGGGSGGAPPSYAPAEEPADEGSEFLRWVQDSLNRSLGMRLPLNGILGPATRSALRTFQERSGLPADGKINPEVERALRATSEYQPQSSSRDSRGGDMFTGYSREGLSGGGYARRIPERGHGDEGEWEWTGEADHSWLRELEEPGVSHEVDRSSQAYARWVQSALNQILGLNLAVDGAIGRATRSAIRSFQTRAGLSVDGDVGPITEAALIRAGAAPFSTGAGAVSPQPSVNPTGFIPIPVESPGGGRIRDKRDPSPSDLVTVQGVSRKIRLHRLAADAWSALVAAARADGLASPLLLLTSGYRSYAEQARLFKQGVARYGSEQAARKWVAPPGGSAHQSGRAIDFHLGSSNSSSNVANLRQTHAYQWLVRNARRFGFYPYENEPWHWEYNPPQSSGGVSPEREYEYEEGELGEGELEEEVNRTSKDYIRWYQAALNRILGLRLSVDGIAGAMTRSAVRSFQESRRLDVDGNVGPNTEAALVADGAGQPPQAAAGMGGGTLSRAATVAALVEQYRSPHFPFGLAMAIAENESELDPTVRQSRSGALGLWQVIPKYAADYGLGSPKDASDPELSTRGVMETLGKQAARIDKLAPGLSPDDRAGLIYYSHGEGMGSLRRALARVEAQGVPVTLESVLAARTTWNSADGFRLVSRRWRDWEAAKSALLSGARPANADVLLLDRRSRHARVRRGG